MFFGRERKEADSRLYILDFRLHFPAFLQNKIISVLLSFACVHAFAFSQTT